MTAREMLNKVKDICGNHEACKGCPLYFKGCLLHYVPATEWSDRVMKTILSIVEEDEENAENSR